MANLKVLFFPIVLVFAFFVSWQFSKPLFDEGISFKNKKIPELQTLLDQEQDLQQRGEKLFNEGNTPEGSGARVIKAIPDNKEIKNLIFQMDSIAKKEGLAIQSLKIEEENEASLNASALGIMQSGGAASKVIKGSMEVLGSYSKFKLLLKDFSNLDRITNVNGIAITNDSNSSEGSITGKYAIDFNAFWQPMVSPISVKAGLESKEVN